MANQLAPGTGKTHGEPGSSSRKNIAVAELTPPAGWAASVEPSTGTQ